MRRGPDRTASRPVPCSGEGCTETLTVSGKRLEAAESGKPVYHSAECRKANTRVTLPCATCASPVERYKSTLTNQATARVFCDSCIASGNAATKAKKGTTKPCATCGTPVYRRPYRGEDGPRFCSRKCHGARLVGERVERIERPCEWCGTMMRLTPQQRRIDVRTCSRECTAANRRAKPDERYVDEKGYVWVTASDGRRMLEHRLVMEQHLGRPLLSTETVHHKTGGFAGRSNNDLSNLELWTGSHPAGHRVEDVVAYCREMLGVYGDEGESDRYAAEAVALLGEVSARH